MPKIELNVRPDLRLKPTLGVRLQRTADRVGQWLFPHAGTLTGWEPAVAGGPQSLGSLFMQMTGTPKESWLTQPLDVSRAELIAALKTQGHTDSGPIELAFVQIKTVPAAAQERNLRVAFQLAAWGVSPATVAAAILVEHPHPEKIANQAVRQALENITKLNSLQCKCVYEDKQQVDLFRNLLVLAADSHETLLALAAKDLIDLRLYSRGEKDPKMERALRAFNGTSFMLKMLNVKEYRELRRLALLQVNPELFARIKQFIAERTDLDEVVAMEKLKNVADDLELTLSLHEIPHQLEFRIKDEPSTADKLASKGEAHDLNGVRIILPSNIAADCYQALFAIRDYFTAETWSEAKDRYDDYIARPKPSTYQALHAIFRNQADYHVEIQIRTAEMHRNAEYGQANHANYKAGKNIPDAIATTPAEAFSLKQQNLRESGLHVVYDAESGQLYQLVCHDGSTSPTVLDFAFAKNINLGLHAQVGFINGRRRSLGDTLASGDLVKVVQGTPDHKLDRTAGVNTVLARGIAQAWNQGLIKPNQPLDLVRLVRKGQALFDAMVSDLRRETLALAGKYFSLGQPAVLFSLERLIKQKGYAYKDELLLVLGLAQEGLDLASLILKVKQRLSQNLVLSSVLAGKKSARLELATLNVPGIVHRLLVMFRQSGIRIISLAQAPIKGSDFGLLNIEVAYEEPGRLDVFLNDLENIYHGIPPVSRQFGKIMAIQLRVGHTADKPKVIEAVLGEIIKLGANIGGAQMPQAAAGQDVKYTLVLQLPAGAKGKKVSSTLSDKLVGIKGIRSVVIESPGRRSS